MAKFRREFKNVVYNYTDAEAKVRESTSNDPWGPSSALMSELAEYTYHVQAYSLVMGMLWKRLNDHGRNWRHVYKSLVVLEYLIKSGSERVVQQCKDNIFSIQTLKDFQYVDKDGKDQGTNIREKAKQLVAILKDDKRLKEERVRAHQARERQEGVGSDSPRARSERRVQFQEEASAPEQIPEGKSVEQNVEQARPTDESEEELQLRLALQLSKQQAEEEEKVRQQEEDSLKAAIALSEAETKQEEEKKDEREEEGGTGGGDLLLDLDSSGLHDPWGAKITEAPPSYDDATGGLALNDPWSSLPATTSMPAQDPFAPVNVHTSVPLASDPWAPAINTATPFAPQVATQPPAPASTASLNPFDLSGLGPVLLPPSTSSGDSPMPSRVEDAFLGNNSNLVDLDLLLAQPPQKSHSSGTSSPINPFGTPPVQHRGSGMNPFDANKPPAPTLSQLAQVNQGYPSGDLLPPPLIPVGGQTAGSQLFPTQPLAPQPFGPARNQSPNPFS